MSAKRILTNTTLLLICVAGFLGLSVAHAQAPTSIPAYRMSAEQLQREYAANEIAAESKYKNRIVEVSGIVAEVGRELFTREAYIVLGAMRVRCVFPNETEGSVAGLTVGQRATVRGVVIQPYGMFVLLKRCSLVPAAKEDAETNLPRENMPKPAVRIPAASTRKNTNSVVTRPTPAAPQLRTTEACLWKSKTPSTAPRGEGFDRALVAVSPDGRHVALAEQRGTGMAITVDGQEWNVRYRNVSIIQFSLDGERVAWVATDDQPGRRPSDVLFVDRVEVARGLTTAGGWKVDFSFSSDSKHYACAADMLDTNTTLISSSLIFDGNRLSGELRPFYRFSPTGGHYVYMTRGRSKMSIVFDGVAHEITAQPFDQLAGPFISPDWKRIAVSHVVSENRQSHPIGIVIEPDGTRTLIGDVNKQFSRSGNVYWSPTYDHVVFPAAVEGGTTMVFDGRPGKTHGEISMVAGTHGFSPDGAHYAYVGDGMVVLDGEAVAPEKGPGKIWKLKFSPDGKHLAYMGEWNHKSMIVVDRAIVEESVDQVTEGTSLHFSPDSKRFQFSSSGRDFMDGPEVEGGRRLSADGRHQAYVAQVGSGYRVVSDGIEGKLYSSIIPDSLCFDPEGKHLVYLAQSGVTNPSYQTETWVLVADGRESNTYPRFLNMGRSSTLTSYSQPLSSQSRVHDEASKWICFDGPDSFHAVAIRNGEILRVEGRIPSK